MLKAIIKESVREAMREEWFKCFEMLIYYVDDVEQADIEATFNPVDYKNDDFVDIKDWFNHENHLFILLIFQIFCFSSHLFSCCI